jgi:hypothetical protein
MPSIAFSLPIKSAEKGQEFMAALTGERAGEHHATSGQHGFSRIKVFRQHTPDERVVVYLEADDLEAAIKSRMSSDHGHDKFWADMVEQVTGHAPGSTHAKGLPSVLLMDWHPTKGVSTSHHD